jgi:predicted ATP-dependent endonuclease of OLD family
MRYKRFVIQNYRAIIGPLEIKLEKSGLTPIVGVNESGKTTVLNALFAFDYLNDELNDGGRHLKDVTSLIHVSPPPAYVTAEIELSKAELKRAASAGDKQNDRQRSYFQSLQRRTKLPGTVYIHPNLSTRKYSIYPYEFGDAEQIKNAAEGPTPLPKPTRCGSPSSAPPLTAGTPLCKTAFSSFAAPH